MLEDVRHIMMLARINLTDKEIERFSRQLSDIVQYISQLKEINTEGIEPTSHVIPLNNVFREDLIQPSAHRNEMLQNAPDSNDKFYIVPKIIE